MAKAQERDVYQIGWPHGRELYARFAAGMTQRLLADVMRKSQVDPTMINSDDGPLTITYTVKVTVDMALGTQGYQSIDVTVFELGISE